MIDDPVDRTYGRATPAGVREILDDAVRRLAVGSDQLWERLGAASLALGRLSKHDMPSGGDRRLLDYIRLRVRTLDLAEHSPYELEGPGFDVSDAELEAIAADIVALRDHAVLRAILESPLVR